MRTTDLVLSTALIVDNFKIAKIERFYIIKDNKKEQRAIFYFEDSPQLEQSINNFRRDLIVAPVALILRKHRALKGLSKKQDVEDTHSQN